MTARSFTFTADVDGPHAHVTVRCGQEGQRALCGALTLRADEWQALRERLAPHAEGDRVVLPIGAAADVEARIRALASAEAALRGDKDRDWISVTIFHPSAEVLAYVARPRRAAAMFAAGTPTSGSSNASGRSASPSTTSRRRRRARRRRGRRARTAARPRARASARAASR